MRSVKLGGKGVRAVDDETLMKYLEPAVDLLTARVRPYGVYLFGSGARGQLRPDSDIDLAYLSDITLTRYEQFLLAQELADKLHREVDLADLSTASTVFATQIVAKGKLIVCLDKTRVAEFHMRTLKAYALLNEERAPILDKIRERVNTV